MKQHLKVKFIFFTLFFVLLSQSTNAAKCEFGKKISSDLQDQELFLTSAIYSLHLQLTNENFSTTESQTSRANLFDVIFDTNYWSKKFNSDLEFKIFWNWVRFQYWGLLQQQALIREDQGFKISNDTTLRQSYPALLRHPIFPFVYKAKDMECSSSQKTFYPCETLKNFSVVYSPALACENNDQIKVFTFEYFVNKNTNGFLIADIKFKGRHLILDSFIEFDNLVNKVGSEMALSYYKKHLSKSVLVIPEVKPALIGSDHFFKTYKIKVPTYPLVY